MSNVHRSSTSPRDILLKLFGDKWKFMIIGHLLNGPQYYGELLANLEPISKKVLTQNLRELEEMMIVSKEIHQQNKIIKVQYSLTKVGHSLKALLNDLMEWGVDYSRYYKNNVVKEQKNG